MSVKKSEIEQYIKDLEEAKQKLLQRHASIKEAMKQCENEILMNEGAQRAMRNKFLTKLPTIPTPPIPAPKKTGKKSTKKVE